MPIRITRTEPPSLSGRFGQQIAGSPRFDVVSEDASLSENGPQFDYPGVSITENGNTRLARIDMARLGGKRASELARMFFMEVDDVIRELTHRRANRHMVRQLHDQTYLSWPGSTAVAVRNLRDARPRSGYRTGNRPLTVSRGNFAIYGNGTIVLPLNDRAWAAIGDYVTRLAQRQAFQQAQGQLAGLQRDARTLRQSANALNELKRLRSRELSQRSNAIGMLKLMEMMTAVMADKPKSNPSSSDRREVAVFQARLRSAIDSASDAMLNNPIGYERTTARIQAAAGRLLVDLRSAGLAARARTVAAHWEDFTNSDRQPIQNDLIFAYSALLDTPSEAQALSDIEGVFGWLVQGAPRPTRVPTNLPPRFRASLASTQARALPSTALAYLATAADVGGRTVANIPGPNSFAISMISVFGPTIASRVRSVEGAQQAGGLMFRLVCRVARLNQSETNQLLAHVSRRSSDGLEDARNLLTRKWPSRSVGGLLIFLNLAAMFSVITSDAERTLTDWAAMAGSGLNAALGGAKLFLGAERAAASTVLPKLGGIAAVLAVGIALGTASNEFSSGDKVGGVIALVDAGGALVSLVGFFMVAGASNAWNGIGEVLMLIGVLIGLIAFIWGALRAWFTAGPKRVAEGILAAFKQDGSPYRSLLDRRSQSPASARPRIDTMRRSVDALERALNGASFWDISPDAVPTLVEMGLCPPEIKVLIDESEDRTNRLVRSSAGWTSAARRRCARINSEAEILPPTDVANLVENGAGRKLAASEVRYLVLEGGGGKGLVFKGALEELENRQVLSQLRGVAGSSAGAITALGLSCGYSVAEIDLLSKPPYQNFLGFIDLPEETRQISTLGRGCVNAAGPDILDEQVFARVEAQLRDILSDNILTRSAAPSVARRAALQVRSVMHSAAMTGLSPNAGLVRKLASPASLYYARNLWDDLGLFSGCVAHRYFQRVLALRGGTPNMTFAQHYERFGKKLVVTGSNLETGRTELFSPDKTPGMQVADAVRISMGLPFAFKPVRISRRQAAQITQGTSSSNPGAYVGLWADGGLWNNLPITAFAGDEEQVPGTLGIVLDNSALERTPVQDLVSFVGAFYQRRHADEAQLNTTPSYRQQVITLDTEGTSTMNFAPDPGILSQRQEDARQAVVRYFS
ncbi:MAG: patatin-like phospholipase family protein [Pseudomonadota bacterium]